MFVSIVTVMGKYEWPKQFCFHCNEPVHGLCRHYRRKHSYYPQPDFPSPPAIQPLSQTSILSSNSSAALRTPSTLPRPLQSPQSTRHGALVPATLVVNRPTADDDDWLREPLCQVDIFEGVTSPVCNGSGDVPPAPPPRSSITTSVFPRRMVDRGTHEDGDLEPHCRIRRYLLHPPMHRLQVIDCEDSNQVVTHKEAAFAARHNPGRPHRVSDGTTCTAHFVGFHQSLPTK